MSPGHPVEFNQLDDDFENPEVCHMHWTFSQRSVLWCLRLRLPVVNCHNLFVGQRHLVYRSEFNFKLALWIFISSWCEYTFVCDLLHFHLSHLLWLWLHSVKLHQTNFSGLFNLLYVWISIFSLSAALCVSLWGYCGLRMEVCWGAGMIMLPQGKRVSFGNLPRLPRHDTGTKHREIFTQALCSVWGSVRGRNTACGVVINMVEWAKRREESGASQAWSKEKRGAKQQCFFLCHLLLERFVLVNWGFYQRLFSDSKLYTAGAID